MTLENNNTMIEEQKQEQIPTQSEVAQEETQEQINWRKFRQQREEEAKRAREAEELAAKRAAEAEALKAALDAVLNKPTQNHVQYETDEDEETIFRKRVERLLAEKQEVERRQREEEERKQLPVKLQQTYGDFQAVCTQENLDYLEYHYPEVAAGLQYMPDSFDKWSTVYKAVKRFVPNTNGQKAMQKVEQNLSKPQSVNTGLSSTSDVSPVLHLDEDKKRKNWERMRRLSKGI